MMIIRGDHLNLEVFVTLEVHLPINTSLHWWPLPFTLLIGWFQMFPPAVSGRGSMSRGRVLCSLRTIKMRTESFAAEYTTQS